MIILVLLPSFTYILYHEISEQIYKKNKSIYNLIVMIKFKTHIEQHEALKHHILAETNDWFKIKELIEEITGE